MLSAADIQGRPWQAVERALHQASSALLARSRRRRRNSPVVPHQPPVCGVRCACEYNGVDGVVAGLVLQAAQPFDDVRRRCLKPSETDTTRTTEHHEASRLARDGHIDGWLVGNSGANSLREASQVTHMNCLVLILFLERGTATAGRNRTTCGSGAAMRRQRQCGYASKKTFVGAQRRRRLAIRPNGVRVHTRVTGAMHGCVWTGFASARQGSGSTLTGWFHAAVLASVRS